jgi:hypothetical protein
VTRLGDRALTRRRFGAPTYTAGRPSSPSYTDSTFQGSLQPMRGKDRQVLPEGLRQRDGRKVYCDRNQLRVDDQDDGTLADQVLVDGQAFTVVHVDSDHPLIEHDHVLILRTQEGS